MGGWQLLNEPAKPKKEKFKSLSQLTGNDRKIIPVENYKVKARILGIKNYQGIQLSTDLLGDEVPLDLALGWGPLLSEQKASLVTWSQSNRFYYWSISPKNGKKFGGNYLTEISQNSANTHVIPDNEQIEKELNSFKVGQIVELEGQLVNLERETPNGGKMTFLTSLVRTDTGAGACEIFLIKKIDNSQKNQNAWEK